MTILENGDKKQRAEDIFALLNGDRTAATSEEVERLNTWRRHTNGLDLKKKENVVEFIYIKLGGRVITEEEAKEIQVRKEEIKKKRSKKND